PTHHPVPLHDALPIFLDRIGEPARRARDRRGAVALGNHLPEAARLVARWHEEEVGARVDAVGERIVEAESRADPARVVALDGGEDRKSTRLNSSHVKI